MNCYLEGIKQKALLNYTVDKWKFVVSTPRAQRAEF